MGLEMERRACIEYELGYYQAEIIGSVQVSCALRRQQHLLFSCAGMSFTSYLSDGNKTSSACSTVLYHGLPKVQILQ